MSLYLTIAFIVLLPVFVTILKTINWLLKVRRIRKAIEVFNVTKPHWLYGHLKEHPGPNEAGLMKFLEWMEKAKDGCFSVLYPLRPTLVLCHPDTVKLILKGSEPKGMLPALGWSYWIVDYWLGNGILNDNGTSWFRKRRLLTPAFHFEILKPYTKIFNECVEKLMDKFEDQGKDGKSVEIFMPTSLCTLNAVMRCSFSSTEDVQSAGEQSPYVKCIQTLANLMFERLFQPLLYSDKLYFLTKDGKDFLKECKFSHAVTDKCINKRREALTEGKGSKERLVDFLDILLLAKDDNGYGLTHKEIRDEVETFMFEGHDTMAGSLVWCLYNLARHPQYQTRAREEVDEVMQGKSTIEYDDLNHLTYLTMCLKESMRLHTTVTFVQRELTKPTTLAGQTLEVGTPIEVNIWCVHHNPHVWGEDHMTYNPDRFLPDNMVKMDSYAFIAFSAGPRNCIAQVFAMNEFKVSVARILHRFELSVDESHHVEMVPQMITRPKEGIKLFFKKRQA